MKSDLHHVEVLLAARNRICTRICDGHPAYPLGGKLLEKLIRLVCLNG
jgi:hypothetical protein